jgi:dipeptidyl aminopeptidase/acylaminoacyl peptidase
MTTLPALVAAAALAISLGVTAAPAAAQTPPVIEERGDLIVENVPATPPAVRERLRQYTNVRSAALVDFLDGGALILTRFGDTAQLHHVAAPMGARRQLTFFDDRVTGAESRPGAPGAFLYSRDAGGDENFQGFLHDPADGRSVRFTEEGTRNQSMTFSRDGARIAWSRSTQDSGDHDILVASAHDPSDRRVALEGEGTLSVLDWSPSGDRLLLSEYVSIAKSKLFVLEVASGALRELTPSLNVSYGGGEFTADGEAVLTTSDEGSEYRRLVLLNLANDSRAFLSPPDLGWDVEAFDLSPDGRTIAWAVNAGGASEVRLMGLRDRRFIPSPELPAGVVDGLQWDAAGDRLGFTLNAATAPADAYTFEPATRTLTRWTQSETGGLPASTFIEPTLARFPTFDTASGGPKEITAWVYEPRTPGPHPVVIDIHGGPESQSRPTFSSTRQYWANELGIAVVVPNVRGSTGYGKTFVSLDNGVKRLDSVEDVGATLDWMATQPQRFDMARVIPYGGSYGGYMVYASMVMYPDRFAGGVNIVGISSLRTFLENTSGYRRDLRRAEYGDERDPAIRAWMEETAALNNADRIAKPLFVIHGANDPRVPLSEARQMVDALRARGVETWLMVGKSEGHGFARRSNQEAQREAETLFFEKVFGAD